MDFILYIPFPKLAVCIVMQAGPIIPPTRGASKAALTNSDAGRDNSNVSKNINNNNRNAIDFRVEDNQYSGFNNSPSSASSSSSQINGSIRYNSNNKNINITKKPQGLDKDYEPYESLSNQNTRSGVNIAKYEIKDATNRNKDYPHEKLKPIIRSSSKNHSEFKPENKESREELDSKYKNNYQVRMPAIKYPELDSAYIDPSNISVEFVEKSSPLNTISTYDHSINVEERRNNIKAGINSKAVNTEVFSNLESSIEKANRVRFDNSINVIEMSSPNSPENEASSSIILPSRESHIDRDKKISKNLVGILKNKHIRSNLINSAALNTLDSDSGSEYFDSSEDDSSHNLLVEKINVNGKHSPLVFGDDSLDVENGIVESGLLSLSLLSSDELSMDGDSSHSTNMSPAVNSNVKVDSLHRQLSTSLKDITPDVSFSPGFYYAAGADNSVGEFSSFPNDNGITPKAKASKVSTAEVDNNKNKSKTGLENMLSGIDVYMKQDLNHSKPEEEKTGFAGKAHKEKVANADHIKQSSYEKVIKSELDKSKPAISLYNNNSKASESSSVNSSPSVSGSIRSPINYATRQNSSSFTSNKQFMKSSPTNRQVKSSVVLDREMNMKKITVAIYIDIYKSMRSIKITSAMTCDKIIACILKAFQIAPDPSLTLFEVCEDIELERPIRDWEFVSDLVDSWDKLAVRNHMAIRSYSYRDTVSPIVIVGKYPSMHGYMHYEYKPGRWQKRYFLLKGDSLYHYNSKENLQHETLFCSLNNIDVYSNLGKKRKMATDYFFALRFQNSINIYETKSDYIKYLCVDEASQMEDWMVAIRLARSEIMFSQQPELFEPYENMPVKTRIQKRAELKVEQNVPKMNIDPLLDIKMGNVEPIDIVEEKLKNNIYNGKLKGNFTEEDVPLGMTRIGSSSSSNNRSNLIVNGHNSNNGLPSPILAPLLQFDNNSKILPGSVAAQAAARKKSNASDNKHNIKVNLIPQPLKSTVKYVDDGDSDDNTPLAFAASPMTSTPVKAIKTMGQVNNSPKYGISGMNKPLVDVSDSINCIHCGCSDLKRSNMKGKCLNCHHYHKE